MSHNKLVRNDHFAQRMGDDASSVEQHEVDMFILNKEDQKCKSEAAAEAPHEESAQILPEQPKSPVLLDEHAYLLYPFASNVGHLQANTGLCTAALGFKQK